MQRNSFPYSRPPADWVDVMAAMLVVAAGTDCTGAVLDIVGVVEVEDIKTTKVLGESPKGSQQILGRLFWDAV